MELAKYKTPNLGLTVAPKPEDKALALVEHQASVAERLSELQLSGPVFSAVLAKTAGTPIPLARETNPERLESMWTQIVKLLEPKIEDGVTDEMWEEHLLTLNDWLIREYGMGLSCEELELAYNALVKEELTKEGRLLEAYPKLDTRHLGEVIAAYRRQVNGDSTIQKIISEHLYLQPQTEPTPAEIDAYMEKAVGEAIRVTERGINYFDLGNGLYKWLFKKGRINPTDTEWEEAIILAKARVLESLAYQKEIVSKLQGWGADEDLRVDGFQPLRAVIRGRLADAMNEEGPEYARSVRSEAFRVCLTNWLRKKAGGVEEPIYYLPTAPVLPPVDNGAQKPFSHLAYIEALKQQLPTMGDEQVSNLQRFSRIRNVLDVYELTTAEWERRQANQRANQQSKKKR